MPIYVYVCESCENSFEISQSIKDDPLVHCDNCDEDALYKSIQPAFIVGEPTTIGALAERNTKKIGRYELENLRSKHKSDGKEAKNQLMGEQKKGPKSDLYKKINKMTDKQKKRYIQDGKL